VCFDEIHARAALAFDAAFLNSFSFHFIYVRSSSAVVGVKLFEHFIHYIGLW